MPLELILKGNICYFCITVEQRKKNMGEILSALWRNLNVVWKFDFLDLKKKLSWKIQLDITHQPSPDPWVLNTQSTLFGLMPCCYKGTDQLENVPHEG